MKKSALKSAIATALGITALVASSVASAGVISATWTGYFLAADSNGAFIANTSISGKSNNQFVTPISGTLMIDDMTGAGSATVAAFEFCSNQTGLPSQFTDISLQAIGDGMNGSGSLVLANMLWNWNGTVGAPVSVVLDAAGLFGAGGSGFAVGQVISGVGATPASDGTYVGSQPGSYENALGYLAMGPMPMATTAWNTSFAAGCNIGSGCMGVSTSGILPLVLDTTPNGGYDIVANTGAQPGTWDAYGDVYGIGGSPMADGPFQGSNFNFNIGAITIAGYDPNGIMLPNCDIDPYGRYALGNFECGTTVPQVPIPAAAWLFGSGLLGLMGVARRRKD